MVILIIGIILVKCQKKCDVKVTEFSILHIFELEHVLDLVHQAVQVLPRVPIGVVARQLRQEIKLGREVLHVLVVRHGGAELGVGQQGGLV